MSSKKGDSSKKQKLSIILKKIWDILYNNKGKVELIAAILTISTIVLTPMFGLLDNKCEVSIAETVDYSYERDLTLNTGSDQAITSYHDNVPDIIFDIVNHNDTPLYINSKNAISVEVLDAYYYPDILKGLDDFSYPWNEPIVWRCNIIPKAGEYAAIPEKKDKSDINGNEFLIVESEELTRFILKINFRGYGYYNIRIKVKYRYKDKTMTFQSKEYFCKIGFGKASIIENKY